MRTPNTACIICAKPLYRRPNEVARTRFAACMVHRAEAQKLAGITDRQQAGLALGREKGTNHRAGYRHREESKAKVSASNRKFWAAHPVELEQRGAKLRGELHYQWKGGASKLNIAIRQMTENRKWMDAVKARDGGCVRCGGTDKLQSHHKRGLAELIEALSIKSVEDARQHSAVLWDLENGETLCEPCHYAEHGRTLPCD